MTVIARENISITSMFKYRLRGFPDRLFDKVATAHFIITTDTMICVPRQIFFWVIQKRRRAMHLARIGKGRYIQGFMGTPEGKR